MEGSEVLDLASELLGKVGFRVSGSACGGRCSIGVGCMVGVGVGDTVSGIGVGGRTRGGISGGGSCDRIGITVVDTDGKEVNGSV